MTASRDPDRLVQAFLEEGPAVLPDRVLDAMRDDIQNTRQRAMAGSWRFTTMRTFLASAAVVAGLVVAGGVWWATRSPMPQPGTIASPSALEPTADPRPVGTLIPGQTYHERYFGEPLRFTLPEQFGTDVTGDSWNVHSFRLDDASSGVITIHDDVLLTNDICHPTGVIDDVPATLDEVGAWLEASEGLAVTFGGDLATVENAGYIRLWAARYWDIELGADCYADTDAPPGTPVVWFQAGERHRVYAVMTDGRDDVIIIFTWGAGYGGEGDDVLDALNPLTNRLVNGLDFDEAANLNP